MAFPDDEVDPNGRVVSVCIRATPLPLAIPGLSDRFALVIDGLCRVA